MCLFSLLFFVFWLWFCCLLRVFGCCVFLFSPWNHIISVHHEPEAYYSIGFYCRIHTASKYLHNDLARAIKALEQKKKNTCWSPKSQCVYGPENEIVAVTFFAKIGAALTNSSALASPTERQDPGERLLIEGLIAPPRAKEHVANLSQSTMLFGIVGVVGAGFHSMAWVRC